MARAFALVVVVTTLSGCGVFGGDSDQQQAPARNVVQIVATETVEQRGDVWTFHTEKEFRPPAVTVLTGPANATSRGHIFLTPRTPDPDRATGPTILDNQGRLVYHRPIPDRVTSNLARHVYKGQPIMSWGERPPVATPADIFKVDPEQAFHVLYDTGYKEIAKVRAAGRGVGTDMHELVITERDTALILGFRTITRDLTAVGGSAEDEVIDSVVQEVEPETGRVLLDWSAAEQIPISDSMFPLPTGEDAWDAYHANTISVARDGNLLVTFRHTSAVYKIDRQSGEIIWTLGGESSDFDMGRGTDFLFPHDAQELPDGTLMLFDNGATDKDRRKKYSRVITLEVDERRKRATLASEIVHDPPILAVSQGGARRLENGNVFVGWGNRQWFSEYTRHGQPVFDAALPSVAYQSYRAFKAPWKTKPGGQPALVASIARNRTLAYASWNGATEIARWRVLGGRTERALQPLGTADWEGFETKLDIARVLPVVQVEALDEKGNVLGRSGVVRPGD